MEHNRNFEKSVEKIFKAPAQFVERELEAAKKEEQIIVSKNPLKLAEEYWETLGPGLTTGAADNDPSGITTYSQTGAQYGLQLIWLSFFTFPFLAISQEMCARIGLITGRGLAANIRHHYSSHILYIVTGLLFFANTLNIAADLGAMAASTQLVFPLINLELMVIFFAVISLLLQIFTTYARYAKYLKYLALTLFSYVIVAFIVHLDWSKVLYHTVIPTLSFSKDQIFLLCAFLGTTISPYLFFWQTSQEVEESILRGEKTTKTERSNATPENVRRMRTDIWSGMLFSNLVTFFIIAACAGTLYVHGITHIATAAQAASALRPFGAVSELLFAFGIVSTGLLAVPVMAGSTAYAIAESFGWKYGLYRKLKQAYAFYGAIIISMFLGIIANLLHLDPIKGLIWAAVANGIIAPIILFFVVRLSSNKRLMSEHANRPIISFIGWVTIIVMAISGIAAILTF